MIDFAAVTARRPPLALSPLSLSWDAGVHAVLGAERDGGPLLLALAAGAARPRTGRVRVLDGAPEDPRVRPQIAFVRRDPPLPERMRVREILACAAVIRGEAPRPDEDRLRVLGVEALAARSSGSLSLEERRAVAMAEAATSAAVRVLLVEEPFAAMDPRAAARLREVLRARSREGCAVVFTTSSTRDAADLADDRIVLRGGSVAGPPSALGAELGAGDQGGRLRVVVSDPVALAAALAADGAVEAVARRERSVVVRGPDALELARAVGRAVLASGVDLVEMTAEPPPPDATLADAPSARGPS